MNPESRNTAGPSLVRNEVLTTECESQHQCFLQKHHFKVIPEDSASLSGPDLPVQELL